MAANVARAERTLSLLTTTYLANTEAVKANITLVLNAVLSQNLFAFIDAPDVPANVAKQYVTAIHKWIARVNSLVTGKTSDSRIAGVLLMRRTALQSPQLLAENVSKWTTALLNMLSKAESAVVMTATLQTLLTFIDAVRDVQVFRREIINGQVPRMNQAILVLAEKNPAVADQALGVLIHSASWFPTLFRPSIDKAEALCLRVLGAPGVQPESELCSLAAKCLAATSQAGGKLTAEERWFQVMQQAMGTIKQCVDHITCANMNSGGAGALPAFLLPQLADDFIVSVPQAADRISAMAEVLVSMLTRPTSADVPIPVSSLVSTASLLAMVSVRIANTKTIRAEYDIVPLLTPQIQRAAIRTMAALAISLGSHMQPYLSAVARAIAAINTRQIESPTTQVELHSLIQLYTEQYGYGFVVHLPYELVVSTVGYICPQQKAISAVASQPAESRPTAQQSKKRGGHGKARAAELTETDSFAQRLLLRWDDVSTAVLKTVLALLRHTPTVLSSALRTRVDSQVLSLLMLSAIGGMEVPYASRHDDAVFRELLYKCLEASILSPDPWQRAILSHAISAFNAGLMDPSGAVRAACLEALLATEPIVHSRLPAQLRGPDTEENVANENNAVSMLRKGESDPVSHAVPDTTQVEDDTEMATDEPGSIKRFKCESSKPAAPEQRPVHGLQDSLPSDAEITQVPPRAVSPEAVIANKSDTALFTPSNNVQPPTVAHEANHASNDDIVMEGSDSEDDM
ncbi:hypothetical protein GGF46_000732 [Coemansia sp. RSA 552]|nr:hypothetical protein GGF46_000732 [Coemansia sp. RSA 552]